MPCFIEYTLAGTVVRNMTRWVTNYLRPGDVFHSVSLFGAKGNVVTGPNLWSRSKVALSLTGSCQGRRAFAVGISSTLRAWLGRCLVSEWTTYRT